MKRYLPAVVALVLASAGLIYADFVNKLEAKDVYARRVHAITISAITGETLAITGGVTGDVTGNVTGNVTGTLTGQVLGTVPTTQVIGAGGTIAADACGGLKRISSASAVTTDTTNTFTAPAAGNVGCTLRVCNENASDSITLDANANFQSAAAGNVVLGTLDCVEVTSSGASGKWYQIAAAVNN